MSTDLLSQIRQVVRRREHLLTLHAIRQAEDRAISVPEIEEVLLSEDSELIEDYPDDPRGPSCLVLGINRSGRILHVQVSHPPQVWIITVYEPSEEKWIDARRRRR